MPSPEVLIVFLGAVLLLAVTPGPDLLYIAARSAGEGRGAGIASVLGISVGIVGHTLAVSLGLSSLLRAVPLAFAVLRWAGAAYLAYGRVRARDRSIAARINWSLSFEMKRCT